VTDSAHLQDLARFIQASPSSFHAVAEVARRLAEAGFTQQGESAEWETPDLTGGNGTSGKYFVVRDGAIIAWVQPASSGPLTPFRIVGSHTDSPGFKLKPKPTIGTQGWIQAGVEVYGGPLLNSWLDRELEFAGRLAFSDGSTELVRTGPFLRFPQLAVHLDRSVNTDGLTLNPQTHMNPVIGVGSPSEADVVDHLAQLAGRSGADVAGYDIVVADTAAPATFGLGGQLFAAGRLDNLASVHSSVVALLEVAARADGGDASVASALTDIPVLAAFDHEEVGSASRSGAGGPFLADVLARIGISLGATETDRLRAFADSWCLSSDVGHSIHPNYPERHDPANHPIVGGGPLLKINANQRYATDGPGAAEFARACAQAGVVYQEFVSNNSMPCGSTIGPITATRLGIRTIDVGMPVLSMHSAREMCSVDDPAALSAAIGAFLAPAR
jgi:aspartyl aminopeptidase